MKDIVANRKRISLMDKLRLGGMILRDNGPVWTALLGAYYASSSFSEWCFRQVQAMKLARKLPGTSGADVNREIWKRWDWSGGGDEWTISPEWKDSLVRSVLAPAIPPHASVVEIGPGAGRWTEHILPVADHYLGFDISETCVALCREKFASFKGAKFVLTGGSSLPEAADSSVHTVWSHDVFVHINAAETEGYLREFSRVLLPGGVALIHHGASGGTTGGWRSDMTRDRFAALAREAGLEVIEQFATWTDDSGTTHPVGMYDDVISRLRRPLLKTG